jgi:hypothetical protein
MNVDGVGAGCVRVATGVAAVALLLMLTGCGEVEPPASFSPEEAPAQMTIEEVIALIEAATPSPITPEAVAETFALGTTATDVQREMMKQELVGSVVEWDLVVYEVEYAQGKYEVTSKPIEIQSPNALQLVSVVAWVRSRGLDDDALLRSVKTDEPLRIRGVVQGVRFRTVVTIGPAVVTGTHDSSPTT